MSAIDNKLIAIGEVIVGKIDYDLKKKYNTFASLKALFEQKKSITKKLNKVAYGEYN